MKSSKYFDEEWEIELNANYTYIDGITVNASNLERANEKHDKIKDLLNRKESEHAV